MAQPKVVVSLLTDKQNFQRMQASDAYSAGARCALDVEVVYADNNSVQQIRQIFSYIYAPKGTRPIAFVVESVTFEGMELAARAALQEGIGWVLIRGAPPYIGALHEAYPKGIVSTVTTDEEEIGRIQAEQYKILLPRGGRLLYIEGPKDSPAAVLRRRGMLAAIKDTNIEILHTLRGDWTTAYAQKVVSSWLHVEARSDALKPDLVAAQNDTMAVGARRAFIEHRREWNDVPLTGCDGLPEGGRWLVSTGVLAATVVTPTTSGPAIDIIARALAGDCLPPLLVLPVQSCPELPDLAAAVAKKSAAHNTREHTVMLQRSEETVA